MSDAFLRVATEAAREAGAFLRERFGRPHDVRFKGTVDLVTEADRGAEALIADRLRVAFPGHRLLAEEGTRGAAATTGGTPSPYGWIVDPLDGTTNFAHGLPHFAVSIALERDDRPLVGVVYDPIRDELFAAERGQGATCNGSSLRVSPADDVLRSLLATGFSYDLAERADQARVWRTLIDRVQGIRQTGSAALNLCYVAAGRLDGYWERPLRPWDMAAGALIVAEAGGTVTDLAGGAFHPYGSEVLATNGPLHPTLRAAVGARPRGSAGSAD